jgi:hypothetical protein
MKDSSLRSGLHKRRLPTQVNPTPNPFPRGKGNDREGRMRPFPLTLLTGAKAPHLYLSTGCRGHPCPGKRETHGRFHIQLSCSKTIADLVRSPALGRGLG